jgi:hypothetical protein
MESRNFKIFLPHNSVVDLDPHQIKREDPDPQQIYKLDQDPHQSDKLEADPDQFADDKPKCVEYGPI